MFELKFHILFYCNPAHFSTLGLCADVGELRQFSCGLIKQTSPQNFYIPRFIHQSLIICSVKVAGCYLIEQFRDIISIHSHCFNVFSLVSFIFAVFSLSYLVLEGYYCVLELWNARWNELFALLLRTDRPKSAGLGVPAEHRCAHTFMGKF